MTPQWFLKAIITSLIVNFMGIYCKVANEEKQENAKYLDRFGLSQTAKDEKAFQMVKDRIKDVLERIESRTFDNPPDKQGPRKYYYNKYMKLGKTRDDSIDYDAKQIYQRRPSQYNFNNFKEMLIKDSKDSQQVLSPIAKKGTIEDKLKEYAQEVKWKKQMQPTMLSDRISNNNKYSKEDKTILSNFLANNTSLLKNGQNFFKNANPHTNETDTSVRINDETFKLINSYIDRIKNQKGKYLEKHFEKENRKITDYKNKNGTNRIINEHEKENSSLNSIPRISRSLKNLNFKKKRKCYRTDKKAENKKTPITNKLKPRDHRRVRSCDIKMEDLRESFIPNEQLSIYHPKMSLSDQFILQDTMF